MRFFSRFFHREASPYSRLIIYLTGFLYALHYALPLYIDSSFLQNLVDEKIVGLVFAVGNALTVLFLANIPKILRKLGSRRMFVLFALLEVVSLTSLSLLGSPPMLLFVYLLHQVFLNSVFLSLDIVLKSHSSDGKTGHIRGTFFTLLNLAVLCGPFIAGRLLVDSHFQDVYIFAAAMLLPAIYILAFMLPEYSEPKYDHSTFGASLRMIWREKNILSVFLGYFLLQFFYAWMVIYMPIYLYQHIGFSFAQILGFMMPIVLLPFVLFDFLFGIFADTKHDEKRGIMLGFFIMGTATISLVFLNPTSIFVWTAILFITRVGAAMVEIMSESYFYRHTSTRHAEIISDWRNVSPTAYIIAPISATILLSVFHLPLQYLFLVLGFIALSGIHFARKIDS